MASEFTSVPGPAAVPPPARAREILAISFTSAGAQTAEMWLKQSDPLLPRRHIRLDHADSRTLADLGDVVRNEKVGVHLLFAGPQAEIYAARAQALGSGAVSAEVSLLETDAGERRVYCAHCKATTVTGNTLGATVSCSGCARELLIYHHFSRRTASYLGFKANAEEVI